jgi:transposase
MHYFCGLKRSQLGKYFHKSPSTISSWIDTFEKEGGLSRKAKENVYRVYGLEKREWLIRLYKKRPILYLAEAKSLFDKEFNTNISTSYISIILNSSGLTWKVIKRRAIQISQMDILRFLRELSQISWTLESLVFLDEVSFDNRDMLSKKGFGVKGNKIYFRGEYQRKARVSLLCFIGITGLLESFSTEGTFDRKKFVEVCRQFALRNVAVKQYPGPNSLWIMDGARIHCHPGIVYYLRSLGVVVLFLPAY